MNSDKFDKAYCHWCRNYSLTSQQNNNGDVVLYCHSCYKKRVLTTSKKINISKQSYELITSSHKKINKIKKNNKILEKMAFDMACKFINASNNNYITNFIPLIDPKIPFRDFFVANTLWDVTNVIGPKCQDLNIFDYCRKRFLQKYQKSVWLSKKYSNTQSVLIFLKSLCNQAETKMKGLPLSNEIRNIENEKINKMLENPIDVFSNINLILICILDIQQRLQVGSFNYPPSSWECRFLSFVNKNYCSGHDFQKHLIQEFKKIEKTKKFNNILLFTNQWSDKENPKLMLRCIKIKLNGEYK